MGTICDPKLSCSIAEDVGLGTALTIAHELGHVFSLRHYNEEKDCKTLQSTTDVLYIMAPKAIRSYFYTADQQCQLVMGPWSSVCKAKKPECEFLWCELNQSSCLHKNMAWAEGTPCDGGRGQCYQNSCTTTLQLRVVNGGWGTWSTYSNCSRSCGGGIQESVRLCNNPIPENGGKYCTGKRTKYRSCNTEYCTNIDERDFRNNQCQKYNGNNFQIQGLDPGVKWIAKYSGIAKVDRCALYCEVENFSSAYYKLSAKVIDGTKCDPTTYDRAGCDNHLASNKTLDVCGVCGGNNSTCFVIFEQINEPQIIIDNYNDLTVIPEGATQIEIELSEPDIYLALSDSNGNRILNANMQIANFGKEIPYGSTIIYYSGANDVHERIFSNGPLKEALRVDLLSRFAKYIRPNVRWRYIQPRQSSSNNNSTTNINNNNIFYSNNINKFENTIYQPANDEYRWSVGSWEPCSFKCNGTRSRKVSCRNDRLVDDIAPEYCSHILDRPASTEFCNVNCALRTIRKGLKPSRQTIACIFLCLTDSSPAMSTVKVTLLGSMGIGVSCSAKLCETMNHRRILVAGNHNKWKPQSSQHSPQNRHRHYTPPPSYPYPVEAPPTDKNLPKSWRTGTWTQCSVSCGNGTKKRYVSCRDTQGSIETEDKCAHLEMPAAVESCHTGVYCGEWRFGAWSECSQTCGEGQESRYVACVIISPDDEQVVGADDQCDPLLKPPSEQSCRLIQCSTNSNNKNIMNQDVWPSLISAGNPYIWIPGEWSQCSLTCGSGIQQRHVFCVDPLNQSYDDEYCSSSPKPLDIQSCNEIPCPQWVYGDWGPCEATCGPGVTQRRVRYCQFINGTIASSHYCPPSPASITVQQCILPECPPTGHDFSRLLFVERDGGGGINEGGDRRHPSAVAGPRSRARGRPRWFKQPWSQCSTTCGKGEQTRQIKCSHVSTNETVNSRLCKHARKPKNSRECKGNPFCSSVRWVVGKWSQCSKTCNKGFQSRSVRCVERSSNKQLSIEECTHAEMPDERRECSEKVCPYVWFASDWTQCSTSCGPGVQKRTISCRAVTIEGWLIQGHHNITYCDPQLRPRMERTCMNRVCNDGKNYHWKAEDWRECSVTCGSGSQQRRVYCVDSREVRVTSEHCNRLSPPDINKPCFMPHCYSTSCSHLKTNSLSRIDDDYVISIYCHDMNTDNPKEFISLSGNPEENFSEIFPDRLTNPGACPRNGNRSLAGCSDCLLPTAYQQSGLTKFTKLRLNISSLQVITNDFTFATTSGLKSIPYATAGDCYSKSNNCAQEGQRVQGRCGGHCGKCSPARKNRLQLKLNDE
ncbi:hypothetical protein HELRODRAFT_163212 [Helobdella robusta]|uniref:GON domain-containing protein n=1 Tax=Helobdella robusta TaxID=6412 RepID=T1ETT2_HELRO|nr:hypothetical protein HELRODRAFT_163212 [Helobdella robusta]ESN96178.1 hypothetical protein HELRODRAFT_163212 [Helobdella robusta]